MFSGSVSCGAPTSTATTKEALVEAIVKAKNLGFCRILFLCCSNKIVQVYNQNCNCKVVIYNIMFCWLIFCAKFDCNVVQSFVPCIYCGISL